jgi:hypothetical protein
MVEQPGHPCYLQNRQKLLAEHRKMAEAGRVFAAGRYGEAFADTLVRESLAEFEALIPELPYIAASETR